MKPWSTYASSIWGAHPYAKCEEQYCKKHQDWSFNPSSKQGT